MAQSAAPSSSVGIEFWIPISMIVLSSVGLYFFVKFFARTLRARKIPSYPTVSCRVVPESVEFQTIKSTQYSSYFYEPVKAKFMYEVDGKTYEGSRIMRAGYAGLSAQMDEMKQIVEHSTTCYYNPRKPEEAYLALPAHVQNPSNYKLSLFGYGFGVVMMAGLMALFTALLLR